MRTHQYSSIESLIRRRGQMSTTTIVFLILGIVFVVMLLVIGALVAMLMPAIGAARTAARTAQSKNNMKQIGLAFHNYHDTHKTFPPVTLTTTDGDPYHAWMTQLLPYMEQGLAYDQIDFNEPWTADVNQRTFEYMIPQYLHPVALENDPGSTHVNGLGAAHYAANSQIGQDNRALRLRDITDGSSNTILVGEVATGFKPWGDPENKRDPAAGLGGSATQFGSIVAESQGVMFLLADGSVRTIRTDISPTVLDNLANPADGNPIGEY